MPEPPLIVIRETPSLASALVELLRSEGLTVAAVESLREAEILRNALATPYPPVLFCASNGHYCECARRWRDGMLHDSPLIVVGTRDPSMRSEGKLHVVSLPLVPRDLLLLLRRILEEERGFLHEVPRRPSLKGSVAGLV